MALLGLQASHHAHQLRALREAVLLGQRAACLGVVVAVHVHAVVDEVDRRTARPTLALQLGHDGLAHCHEAVDVGRQASEPVPILGAPDTRRVDGVDEIGPGQAARREQVRRKDTHDLRPEHVAVHDLGLPLGQQVGDQRWLTAHRRHPR